ncbi:MAG TPA: acyltransferase [Chthoniobacterales bacterium]|nr:acyltransferase [Chthoniobacterales bacterium]
MEGSFKTVMDYNPRLDALRALCVFGVMCFHWQGILQFGWIGVQTFFVLSGFLMTGILAQAKEKYDAKEFFLVFQWRRALRIFPAYFGYLFFLAGVFWFTRQPSSFPQVIPFLSTLTLNIARLFPWYNNDQAYTHLWSLGVEMQFYLFWPLLIYFTSRERLATLIYFFLVAAPLLRFLTEWQTSVLYADPEAIGNAVYNSPLSHLDAFAAGAAVALGIPGFRSRFGRKFLVLGGITLIAGIALTLISNLHGSPIPSASLGYPINLPNFHSSVWGYTLIDLTSAFLIGLLKTEDLPFFRNAVAQRLGRISYGLYLFHLPVQKLMKLPLGEKAGIDLQSLALFGLSIIGTILLAIVSYEFFEVHFLRLKNLYRPPVMMSGAAGSSGK